MTKEQIRAMYWWAVVQSKATAPAALRDLGRLETLHIFCALKPDVSIAEWSARLAAELEAEGKDEPEAEEEEPPEEVILRPDLMKKPGQVIVSSGGLDEMAADPFFKGHIVEDPPTEEPKK